MKNARASLVPGCTRPTSLNNRKSWWGHKYGSGTTHVNMFLKLMFKSGCLRGCLKTPLSFSCDKQSCDKLMRLE